MRIFKLLPMIIILTACEQQYGLSASGGVTKSDTPTASEDPPPADDTDGSTPAPEAPSEGVGTGKIKDGRLIVYGDEHVARNKQYSQPEISYFWNNAFDFLTKGNGGRIGWVALGSGKDPNWGFQNAHDFVANLSKPLEAKFMVEDFNPSTQSMDDFDAIVFLSYGPELTADKVSNYVRSGKGLMALVVGFDDNDPRAVECANMNALLAKLPYAYDCKNHTSNVPSNNILFQGLNASKIPFSLGYKVISR